MYKKVKDWYEKYDAIQLFWGIYMFLASAFLCWGCYFIISMK